MRWIVLLAAMAMPVVSWFSQSGMFGPTNGAISDRYPTLLVAAGYAFAIWGLIFLWDVVFGLWQLRRRKPDLDGVRGWAACGFALTAAWMPVFSNQWFLPALAIIWAALICLLVAAFRASPLNASGAQRAWAAYPLALHAGWLSMAAFLNTAQVIVAYQWLPTQNMFGWSVVLLVLATLLAWWANHRLRGHFAYPAAVVWALVGVHIKQSGWTLPGADSIAVLALAAGALLVLQTLLLRARAWRHPVPAVAAAHRHRR
ncbi:hypothetical protein [Stenotrophomonas sp. GZD-301]|uniref:hypothetical protein n=1 Tax=Stenotrophomonas sp. GZD-301 TaxID=3404814 RepID=UPI003BB72666